MKELDDSITNGREERRKFLVKKEFEIISNFGARETKWEQLYDKTNDKYIYLNSETLEVMHLEMIFYIGIYQFLLHVYVCHAEKTYQDSCL